MSIRARARRATVARNVRVALFLVVLCVCIASSTAFELRWSFGTMRSTDRASRTFGASPDGSETRDVTGAEKCAKVILTCLALGLGLRASPSMRAGALSYAAVAFACAWYAARRAWTRAVHACTPSSVLRERELFRQEMMRIRRQPSGVSPSPSMKRTPKRGGSKKASTRAELSALARAKLQTAMEMGKQLEGYTVALRSVESAVPASALHEDMICDSGDRERDVRDVYERAVVASGANVDDAEESLRLRAAWHAANELRPAMKAWETFGEKKRRALYECYQGGWYTANTPLGVPVYVERLGTVNMDKLLESITLEDLLQHRLRMQGYMVKTLLPEMAKRDGVIARDKIIHVIDMKGAGLSLVGSKNVNIFKELQQIDKNFPEFLYRTYIVNVPLGARIVWTTFSALLPARVRAKVRILGAMKGGNLAKLSQIMGGDDHVPDFLGGKCARRLDECPPWSLEHMNDTEFVPWEKGVLLTRLAAAAPLSPDSFARVHSRVRKKAVAKNLDEDMDDDSDSELIRARTFDTAERRTSSKVSRFLSFQKV